MNKKPWQSKTLIVNLVLALAAIFYPPAKALIESHPEAVAAVFAVINIILRFLTNGAIVISDDAPAAPQA
jgi:hypothetical protein